MAVAIAHIRDVLLGYVECAGAGGGGQQRGAEAVREVAADGLADLAL